MAYFIISWAPEYMQSLLLDDDTIPSYRCV